VSDFQVWAPDAQTVDLVLDPGPNLQSLPPTHRRLALSAANNGWWRLNASQARPGTDYAFVIDSGRALPDPRSPWQPFGVHGPSRTLDHSEFPWTDHDWRQPALSSAIFYELHVGTFTPEGTFESGICKIDHLVQLGVTHVELMPVAEFPGERGWGYDGVDLFAPHHAYGGPDSLKRFIDACHSRGLAVFLDVVYNHLGPDGNYLGYFGPYFTENYRTPWGKAINLDGPGSIEVRRFFCDNARMWLRDYHLDGLRLDAIHAIFDISAIHFLEQLAAEIKELADECGRPFYLVAENDLNDPRAVTSASAGGLGFDAQWNDDFHHALHAVLTGEHLGYYADFGRLADLAKALKNVYVYDGCPSQYRRRTHGRPVEDLPGDRFVGFLQNHDQIGNRAKGDRTSQMLTIRQLKIGSALVLCAPFLPMLFQGEEFGAATPFLYFTDHGDPELAAAVSKGRREEFASSGWKPEEVPDPQDIRSFQSSKLDWNQIHQQPHEELLRWYRSLIALRRSVPQLGDGSLRDVEVDFSESDSWLILYRGPVAVVCNFSDLLKSVELRFSSRLLLASDPAFRLHERAVDVPRESVLILENPVDSSGVSRINR
jgi:maltooligosyltrehalose trehalohydrolase